MNRLIAEHRCKADLDGVASLRRLLEQVLRCSVREQSLHAPMLLCLSEAATNIVEHAQPAASRLSLRFQQRDRSWVLSLSDDGGAHDPDWGHRRELADVGLDMEDGRGIGLVQASCDSIAYFAGTDGQDNRLVFRWPLDRRRERARVLLVEDEVSLRSLYRHYLASDYEVIECSNGREAIDRLREERVDLVLSDINMPDMDGLDLRAEINRDSEHGALPFVFLTANEGTDARDQASSLGIDDYLVKPVSKANLVERIERVLRRNRQVIDALGARINRKISQSFSSKLDRHPPHWSISVSTRNTGAGGGDLLLSQSMPESTLFALIDTMGHDETAKFFSYAYGGYISGLMRCAEDSTLQCEDLLARISDMAYDDELLSRITLTGIVFRLEADGMLTFASGAHPQPLLVSGDEIRMIPVEGVLPGLLPNTAYEAARIQVRPGERIAIYTDGLFESANDNQARAELERKVWSMIRETASLPVDRAARLIMQTFDEVAGTPPRDDTTFILLEPDSGREEIKHA